MSFMLVPEYSEFNPTGACLCCRVQRRPGERIVDLGVDTDVATDQEGQPAFRESPAQVCETCCKEITHLLGWKTDFIEAQLQEMRTLIGQLQAENRALREVDASVKKLARLG